MAIADENNGQWLTLAQAATPRYTIDTRRRCAIPPGKAEIEKRQHEVVDHLRAARRWRVRSRWSDKEGPWQAGGIPLHWWTHDAVNWTLGLLMRGDRSLWVQVSDDDDQTTTERVAPTIDAAASSPTGAAPAPAAAPPQAVVAKRKAGRQPKDKTPIESARKAILDDGRSPTAYAVRKHLETNGGEWAPSLSTIRRYFNEK